MLFQHVQIQYLGRVSGGIYTLMYQNSKMIAGTMIEVFWLNGGGGGD